MFNNHNHTHYSNASLGFSDAICKTENLIQRAYDLGLTGLTITDHECISSFIQALNYYEKMEKDRPFTLGLGNEIYLLTQQEYENNLNEGGNIPYYHFILTALDTQGYLQICELSTRAWKRAYSNGVWRRPTLYEDLLDIIQPNQGHVVCSTACLGSRIDKLLMENKNTEAIEEVHRLTSIFGQDNVYIECQPANLKDTDQSNVNPKLWELANQCKCKIIPTTDSHYLSKEDNIVHKVFLQSQNGDREVDDFYATAYLMSEEELKEHLLIDFTEEQIEQMFLWSDELGSRITGYDIRHDPIIPQIPVDKIPKNFRKQDEFERFYDEFPNFGYYASLDRPLHEQYFFYQIEQGLIHKIKHTSKVKNIKVYIDRLNKEWRELKEISKALNNSMVSYYSTMSKIIDLMWDVGSIVGPGRGSSAGFLTAYLLDIAQVDPVPLGDYLPYWRHVALERGAEIADIDTDSEPCKKYAIINAVKEYFGEDKVLSVATFGTVSSKTALERACKGLNISDDVGAYLKSLIPVNRGKVTNLVDCLYGNEKEGIKPITELVNEINQYPNLEKCALGICDIICQRGLHAAGLVISNEPYVNFLGAMKAPNGVLCTAFNLWDSEAVGLVKFDLLTVAALQKLHKAIDGMIEDGVIEWQGSVRETYNKYLHPDVIDYTTKEMWQALPQMYSCFQWDTATSSKALAQIQPESIMDLSSGNSLIRLMPENVNETPVQTYIRYKQNKEEWEKDTTAYGLNQVEKDIIWKYCGGAYGLAESQEIIMRLSMDKNVAGYGLKESNQLRKAIAKKSEKLQKEAKKQFFEWGKKQGAREIFIKYIWEVLFSASLGYSFSSIHSYVYSIIALQELNIYYHYNPVYWNLGCLSTESMPTENESGGAGTNYGEMAKAIYKMKRFGVSINPPNINKSNIDFTPVAEQDTILFGIAGIAGINPEIAQQVISNRPYTSFKDFYTKNSYKGSLITPSKFRQLIKAGCFDELNPNRINVMKLYIKYSNEPVTSLTMANMSMILKSKTPIPKSLTAPHAFYKHCTSKQFFYGQHPALKSKKLYWLDNKATRYFKANCQSSLQEGADYFFENDMLIVVDKSLEKLLKPSLNALKEYINTPEFLEEYNKKLLLMKYNEFVPNQDIHRWEMETLSHYQDGKHELDKLDKERYLISDFGDLPEEPVFVEKSWGKKTWKQYQISQIAGVVLDRSDNSHLVTLLTSDNQVINIKFYAGLFANYKRQNSIINEDGKKEVVDPSYFSRGQLLIVSGFRRGESDFVCKRYSKSIFQHTCQRIWNINEDGSAEIQSSRMVEEENKNP